MPKFLITRTVIFSESVEIEADNADCAIHRVENADIVN